MNNLAHYVNILTHSFKLAQNVNNLAHNMNNLARSINILAYSMTMFETMQTILHITMNSFAQRVNNLLFFSVWFRYLIKHMLGLYCCVRCAVYPLIY